MTTMQYGQDIRERASAAARDRCTREGKPAMFDRYYAQELERDAIEPERREREDFSIEASEKAAMSRQAAADLARDLCLAEGKPENFDRHYADALEAEQGRGGGDALRFVRLQGRQTPTRPIPDTRF